MIGNYSPTPLQYISGSVALVVPSLVSAHDRSSRPCSFSALRTELAVMVSYISQMVLFCFCLFWGGGFGRELGVLGVSLARRGWGFLVFCFFWGGGGVWL